MWVRMGKRVATVLLVIFVFDFLFFPLPSIADIESVTTTPKYASKIIVEGSEQESDSQNQDKYLPSMEELEIKYSLTVSMTAYSSSIDECQGDPCITANGFNVCKNDQEDTIATNRLPLGTKVKIPGLYEDKVFIVRDRMNKRYYNRADIWMKSKEKAKQFGIKRNVKLVVVD